MRNTAEAINNENKKHPSESRKVRKPLMEKKRRARINDSLETLKQILLESKTSLKESSAATGENNKKSGQRTAKLEKADILEMTVQYVQQLHNKLNQVKQISKVVKEEIAIRPADSSSGVLKVGVTLLPTKLASGEIVYVVPSTMSRETVKISENVWRPW